MHGFGNYEHFNNTGDGLPAVVVKILRDDVCEVV